MEKTTKPTITIIGAGIAGCFLAILLAKRGLHIEIYEQLSQKDLLDNSSKKSFNLTFYGFGIKALKKAGLWNKIKQKTIHLTGAVTQISKYSKPFTTLIDQRILPYYTITRTELLSILIKTTHQNNRIKLHFDTSIISIDRYKKILIIKKKNNTEYREIPCSVIFGADGINSIVRPYIQQRQNAKHLLETLPWSYKQIYLPEKLVAKLRLQKNHMYAWTRKYASLAAYPQKDGSYAAILMLPEQKKKNFSQLVTPDAIKNFISENFPDLLPGIETISHDLTRNPEGHFVMIHTTPWYYQGFMALVGDSAHGFYPFFGQGISAAFGDCLELDRLIEKYGTNWEKIFPIYQNNRKVHMDTLGDLSKNGFTRYRREKRADYQSIYERLEDIIHTCFPKLTQPSLFKPIATDPDHTADHLKKYRKQKKIYRFLGIPLIVAILTSIVAIQETWNKYLHKK